MRKLKNRTVESVACVIDAAALKHLGVLARPLVGSIHWQNDCSISFASRIITPGEGSAVEFGYWYAGTQCIREFTLWTCQPKFRRVGFVCCGHSNARIYLVNGIIRCRHCSPELSYESRRRSHALWRAKKKLMAGVPVQYLSASDLIALAGLDEWKKTSRLKAKIELQQSTEGVTVA